MGLYCRLEITTNKTTACLLTFPDELEKCSILTQEIITYYAHSTT